VREWFVGGKNGAGGTHCSTVAPMVVHIVGLEKTSVRTRLRAGEGLVLSLANVIHLSLQGPVAGACKWCTEWT